jgi:hypothetical protein
MLATCWTLYTIAGLVVAARVYTQAKVTRQFGIGDIFMLGAVVSCVILQLIIPSKLTQYSRLLASCTLPFLLSPTITAWEGISST